MLPKVYHRARSRPVAAPAHGTVRALRGRRRSRPVAGSGRALTLEHRDVSKISVETVVVQAVPDDELVRDDEPEVIDRDLDLPPGDLVQKRAEGQAPGMARGQVPAEIADGPPAVDDVFHDDH